MRVLPPENLLFVKTEALEQNSSVVRHTASFCAQAVCMRVP